MGPCQRIDLESRYVAMLDASQDAALKERIANGFDDPRDLFPWFAVPAEADRYLQQLAA